MVNTKQFTKIIPSQKAINKLGGRIGGALSGLETGPNYRAASGQTNRDQQIMTWRLPNGSSVQMYINPQNFVVAEKKQIASTRTKGGFIVQYWGDELTQITLSGTTGSSGVKGVQVLRDIYRSENRGFDLVAATQEKDLANLMENVNINEPGIVGVLFNESAKQARERQFILRPSLASMALSILLFYQGTQYRGFFTEFSVTEGTEKLGLFDYTLTFMVTETRGSRDNFMAWHKEPLADGIGARLVSGALNSAGNAIRSFVGLPQQAVNPPQFHPDSAPRSFGGGELGSDPLNTLVDSI